MGKSPGKWIKTVLFGKKHSNSRSNFSKKTAAKTPEENLAGNSPHVPNLPYQLVDRGIENLELENGASGASCNINGSYPDHKGKDSQNNHAPDPSNDAEISRQEQSASKVQAALRGYLARRAFRALKGIIRLQALIRGHLVRRQAVATLCCMHAIVRFQALVRGRRVRLSGSMPEDCMKYTIAKLMDAKQIHGGAYSHFKSEKLATTAFIRKLLASLPTAIPLSLQYDLVEPNSEWNWLERWSISHFWKAKSCSKRGTMNSQRKQGSMNMVESGNGKSRSVRKVSTAVKGTIATASNEIDKPKHNPRKTYSHQTDSVQEQPQSELERVKRSLRKVSASATLASEKSEIETEEPSPPSGSERNTKVVLNSDVSNVSAVKILTSSESPLDSEFVADKLDLAEPPSKLTALNEPESVPQDEHPTMELHSFGNGGKMEILQATDEKSKENVVKENPKIRRKSLPVKQEHAETMSQNTPSLPSYMSATKSARAKLKPQGALKFDEDEADYGFLRRHSLPISTNGKSSSSFPRMPKSAYANSKGGSKTNRSLATSRDDKVLQPGWRR